MNPHRTGRAIGLDVTVETVDLACRNAAADAGVTAERKPGAR
jgi:hypothetical protein